MLSSNLDFEELPQVRLYEPSEDEKSTAMLFGLPAVIERRTDQVFTSTLGHAWRSCGGESFVIQAGRAGDLQLPHCERLFRSLMAFLHHTGLVAGIDLAADDQDSHGELIARLADADGDRGAAAGEGAGAVKLLGC